MPAKFTPSRSGMRTYLRSGDYVPALSAHAELILARAKGTAPVESPESAERSGRIPGQFRDSLEIQRHTSLNRHTVRVASTDPKGAAIEAAHHTLKRAAG